MSTLSRIRGFSLLMALLLSCFSLYGQNLTTDPPHGEYCAGDDGVMLIATGLTTHTYQLEKLDDNTDIWVGLDTIPMDAQGDYDFDEALWEEGAYRLFWEDNGTTDTSDEANITQKDNPEVYTLSNASDECIPVEPYFDNSQQGVTYRLLLNGVDVAEEEGTGGLLEFGEQDGPGTYTAEAFYTEDAQCLVLMNGNIEADPLPEEVAFSPADGFCAGQSAEITFHGTQASTTYYILDADHEEVASIISEEGGELILSLEFGSPGTYKVEAINDNGCRRVFDKEIHVGVTPQKFSVLHTEGCPGTEVGLVDCEDDVRYRLHFTPAPGSKGLEDDIRSIEQECDDGELTFGPQNLPGTYRIEAIHIESGCRVWMNEETTIHPQPQKFSLTPDVSEACVDDVVIGLSQSQEDVSYALIRNDEHEEATVAGNGESITFPPPYEPGSYHIEATFVEGHSCTRVMNGEIMLYNAPGSFNLTVNGDVPDHHLFCADTGVDIGLDGSQAGVAYRLYRGEEQVDSHTGDGEDFEFDYLANAPGAYHITAHRAGCSTPMEGSVQLSSAPAIYSLSASAEAFCEGDEESITLTLANSQPGVLYMLQLDGSDIPGMDENPGTGNALTWEQVSQFGPGEYTVRASFPGDGSCPSITEPVTISTFTPPDVTLSLADDEICTGDCTQLVFEYAGTIPLDIEYAAGNNAEVFSFDPDLGNTQQIQVCPGEDTEYTLLSAAYGDEPFCEFDLSGTSSVELTVQDNPTHFALTSQDDNNCSPVTPVLSGSEAGVSYQLFRASFPVGEAVSGDGDGDEIIFDEVTTSGTYHVEATSPHDCNALMPGMLEVSTSPGLLSVDPSGDACLQDGITIGLSGGTTEAATRYTLLRDGVPQQYIETENSGDEVVFAGINQPGTYEIHAERLSSGCDRMMDGELTLYNAPGTYELTVGGEVPEHHLFCVDTDAEIGLSDSEEGVEYRLHLPDGSYNTQIGEGSPLSFGLFNLAGDYHITAHRAGCSTPMEGSVRLSDGPAKFSLSASSNIFCEGDEESVTLTLANSQPGIQYTLVRDESDDLATQTGTGDPLTWEQVSQFGPGEYTVRASFPEDDGCPVFSNAINVQEITTLEVELTIPGYDEPICKNSCITLHFVYDGPFAVLVTYTDGQDQDTKLLVPSSGPNYTVSNVCPQETSEYTLVSAHPQQHPGCITYFDDQPPIVVEVLDNPAVFQLEGIPAEPHGNNCSPVTPRLNGSQVGVNYHLYREGGTTPVDIKTGTGEALNFEPLTASGNYQVVAYNDDGCSKAMQGTVVVNALPDIYVIEPTGTICSHSNFSVGLDGGPQANTTYSLWHNNQYYGGIEAIDGDEANEVLFEGLNQPGIYQVLATNKETGCERMMAGELQAVQSPQLFKLKPEDPVCLPAQLYLNDSEENAIYGLWKSGGSLPVQLVPGTGEALYFETVHDAATYYVIASSTEFDCTRVMDGQTIVQGLPEIHAITPPPGNYCIDDEITIGLENTTAGTTYALYHNGEPTGLEFTGTDADEPREFTGSQTTPGTYKIKAINQVAGCTNWMEGEIKVNILPYQYNLVKYIDTEELCNPIELGLDQSQVNHQYVLLHDEEEVTVVEGTGHPISFGRVYDPGTYTAYAMNPVTTCSAFMIGEKVVVQGPEYLEVSLEDNNPYYCVEDNTGNHLHMEESEEGVTYQLYRNDEPVAGTAQEGDGGSLEWLDVGEHNGEETEGEFYIVAFSDDPDCHVKMMHAYTISEAIVPVVGFMGDEQPVEVEECAACPLVLDIEFTGQLPMGIIYQLNGMEHHLSIDPAVHSSPYSYTLPTEAYNPEQATMIELIDVYYEVMPFCEGTVENGVASVSFTLPPVASVPDSLALCGLETPALNLMGAQHYSDFEWEIVQGEGYLSDPFGINPSYIPDEADIGNEVLVYLYLTGVDHCDWLVETYSATLTYYVAPVVDAGEDIHLCDDDPIVTLNGNISGSAEEARWELPANGGEISDVWDLSATYTPTMTEISQGETTLTLMMTNDPEGPCHPISDEVTIYFYQDVEVSAGDDQIVCASSPDVHLAGSIGGGAPGATWVGGQGTFDPGPHDPQAIYTPHENEISAGSVTLILETNDPDGPCHADADEMQITIDPRPTIQAGPDHIILAGDTLFIEDAMANTYQDKWWEAANFTGSLEDNWDNLSPVYYSSINDAGETVFLLLKATGLGACADTEYQDTSRVKVGAPIEIDFEAIDNRVDSTLCMRFPAYFQEHIHYGGHTPHEDQYVSKHIWDFGDGTVYETTNPMDTMVFHTYQDYGLYEVEMIAKTAIDGVVIHGDTVMHEVDIRDCTSNNLVFPNALAPNHTHPEVQVFLPRGINIIEYELEIFDMRGNLVWRTTELDEYDGSPSEGWNGTYKNGDPAPQGTYVWQVHARFSNGAVYGHSGEPDQRNSGTVTLIR